MLEILTIYTALALILIPIVRFQGAVHGYSETKEAVFVCLSALAFIVMLFTGLPVLSSAMDWMFLALVAYITLSVYWSDSPTLSIKDIPRWWGVFLLYLASRHVPRETLIMAIFMPSPVIAAYGMYQQIFKKDPIDHWVDDVLRNHTKSHRFYSFLGNSNYTGTYLVGSVFAGLYCVLNVSFYFAPAVALVAVGLFLTKARGAVLAVIVGFLVVVPGLWPIVAAMAIALVIYYWGRWEPVQARVHFLNVGWLIFKERFLFGGGPHVFRRKLFKTQAFMNQKNPRILGTLKEPGIIHTPLARRMHNDHAEMFVEYGLLGGFLWLGIIGLGLYQAFMAGSFFLAGAILAISVNALFFYPIRVIGIGVAFWAFLGTAGSPEPAVAAFFLPPLYLSLPLSAIVCLLVWELAVKRLMSISHMYHYNLAGRANNRKEGEKHLRAAMDLDPTSGHIIAEFAAFYAVQAPPMAMQAAMKAIDQYDGEKIEYSAWVQLGNMAVINGAVELAQVCFKMAMYLNPSYRKPHKCLGELAKLLAKIQSEKAGAPKGYKEKDGVLVPDKPLIEVVK